MRGLDSTRTASAMMSHPLNGTQPTARFHSTVGSFVVVTGQQQDEVQKH